MRTLKRITKTLRSAYSAIRKWRALDWAWAHYLEQAEQRDGQESARVQAIKQAKRVIYLAIACYVSLC